MADGFHALVRRRRDGAVVFDLDPVHAGVVAEALEQTRAVLDDAAPAGRAGPAGGPAAGSGQDDFDAIVAGLSDLSGARDDRGSGPDDGQDGGTGGEQDRDDPVVRRLLPDAFMDDPGASAELRRLSGDSVRGHKVAAIDSVLDDLERLRGRSGGVAVDPARAASWLTALNDARLALGTLLAVGEDDDLHAELDTYEQQVQEQVAGGDVEDGPPGSSSGEQALRAYRIAVYDFLSALLDMVVRVLDR